ncbi:MAG: DUF4317 domain-containing protein [Eubacteriaceae bacterium]|nr:DUF4317 domain-containing protein [Eubacteriaceae bacterium]
MIKNEFAELRRRWKNDYNAVSTVYGYYINSNKDIISSFDTSLGVMDPSEVDMYMSILKKTMSGQIGRNLIDIPFTTEQVEGSEEHQLLMTLKDSELKDSRARDRLVEKIVPNVSFDEDNFLILMAHDSYDIAYRDSNLEDMDDGGSEVYKYFLCCICPVKPPKMKLQYNGDDGEFHTASTGQIAASPELGFMFPAFDDRSTNIYNAVFYTKKPANMYQELLDEVFHVENVPMSAPQQREEFNNVMAAALEKECSFDVVRVLSECVRDKIENHEISKDPENLELSISAMGDMLQESGVSAEKVELFTDACKERFGEHAALNPKNIVETKKFEIETPEVKISIAPENSHLIRTQIIDGCKYILVPAGNGVEINGMAVSMESIEE